MEVAARTMTIGMVTLKAIFAPELSLFDGEPAVQDILPGWDDA